MLLAKVALGFCGTLALVTVYAFHEGVMRVDEEHVGGRHVHVWVPAAIVPVALHVIPRHHVEDAAVQIGPWLPTLRAVTKELGKFPDAQLVEVRNAHEHVRVWTHEGKLMIDVDAPDDTVHVACPLAMVEHITRELEAGAPAA